MRIVRGLLVVGAVGLGAIGAVVGCSSDAEVVGVSQEALTSSMFGYTTIGASWGTFGSGIKAVNRFALSEAGSVSKLSIYVDGNGGPTGTGVMKGVVYADAGGKPGALLATSSEISVASGAAAGWKDLVFGSPVSLSAGSYFVGVLVGGTANVIRETYDVQTGIMRYDGDAYADGASDPYGTATTYNNKMSLYATYTATPKTFGYTTVGASWGIFGSGIKAVNRFALSEAGNVSKLSIYVDGNGGPTGTGVMKGIVYADAGGQPGALLATSNEVSVASGAAAGWRDLVFSSPVSLPTGNYFLGVLVGGTANVIRETYDVQAGIMRYNPDAYADGASNPYGAASTYNNKMSLYATYAGGEPPGPSPDAGGPSTPPPSPGAGLFLGLSFQGLSLKTARPYSNGGYTEIVGTDLVYGNSSPRYPASLWGGGSAAQIDSIQMIWNSPSDQTRRIVTDSSVPAGVSRQVLESTFVNPYVSPAQDNFQFYPDTGAPQGMVYFSKWMWLQPDLASRGPFFAELHEFKTNGASTGGGGNPERFGVNLNLASWTNNKPVWSVAHDGWVNGAYKVYAQSILSPSAGSLASGQTNAAPVPLGQWFRVETAWNRSMNGTGWVWMALTVPGSSDPNLQKGVTVFAQSGAFNFNWNGVTQTVGWNKATNDPIDRVFPFGAYSDLKRSPTSPYTMRQTNIETWTTWPSTATAHPAAFN